MSHTTSGPSHNLETNGQLHSKPIVTDTNDIRLTVMLGSHRWQQALEWRRLKALGCLRWWCMDEGPYFYAFWRNWGKFFQSLQFLQKTPKCLLPELGLKFILFSAPQFCPKLDCTPSTYDELLYNVYEIILFNRFSNNFLSKVITLFKAILVV